MLKQITVNVVVQVLAESEDSALAFVQGCLRSGSRVVGEITATQMETAEGWEVLRFEKKVG